MNDRETTMTAPVTDRAAWPPPTPAASSVSARSRPPGLDRSDVWPRPMPSRVLWVVFGSLMVVGALFWGTMSVVGLLAHEEWTVEHTQSAAGLTTLRVTADTGRVVVRGADTDEVTVTAAVSRGLLRTTEEALVVGESYVLTSDCREFASQWCRVDYDVVVPRDFVVVVQTDNGDVSVRGVTGRIDVISDNGSIELDDVAGPVRARAANGSVVGRTLTSTEVDAASDNGRVELAFAGPPDTVTADSDNGSVTVAVPTVDGDYSVEASTDNGRIDVAVIDDPTSARLIRATTDNGNVAVHPTE